MRTKTIHEPLTDAELGRMLRNEIRWARWRLVFVRNDRDRELRMFGYVSRQYIADVKDSRDYLFELLSIVRDARKARR